MSYEKDIRENDKMMNVFNYYTRLYYNTSSIKYYMDFEDYQQEQEIALYKRYISYYNKEKYNLSTFIIKSIKATNINIYNATVKEKNYLNHRHNHLSLDYSCLIDCDDFLGNKSISQIIKGDEDVNCSLKFLIDNLGVELSDLDKKMLYLTSLMYSSREIDKMLNLKEQTTKNNLRRIRKKFNQSQKVD